MPAQLFTATVVDRVEHTADTFDLLFRPEGDFTFRPGQFVSVDVPNDEDKKIFRAYSIASSPTRSDGEFLLNIKLVTFTHDETGEECRGKGSGYPFDLKEGDTATFLGPAGVLPFDDEAMSPLVLAGTGTGIAPLISILEYMADRGIDRQTTLYFGVRYPEDIYYQERLAELQQRLPQLTVHVGVSRAEADGEGYRAGRLTALIAADFETLAPDTEGYICGSTAVSKAIADELTGLGMTPEKLHVEGYG